MKPISEVTCCIVDSGLFVPMALRMAEACKRVIFWSPDQRGFPSIREGMIGNGFYNVERVLDFWGMLGEIDLFCFPDIGHAGLQQHLVSMGKAVWGSRHGDRLELSREHLMAVLNDLDLEVPTFQVVIGLRELASVLSDKEDCYVKISRWRGDMETTHWRNWKMDSGWIDWLAVNLGPYANHMRFLVFDKIDTKLEIGADTYSVVGQWPGLMLNGIEGKDKSYFAAVTKFADMPEPLVEIMTAVGPLLKDYGYRNQISFEVRVKSDKFWWIDATQRGGMPSTASQHLLWKNFPEIVWHGAHGELVEPEPDAMFSIETMITCKSDTQTWDVVEIPKELEPYARFSNCAYVDGCYVFPPDELHTGDLGWLCCTSDTPRGALEKQKELADMLPDGLSADIESMADVIKEIEEAQSQGIPVTDKTMPEPAEVL